jgi:uncharacterized membrane protein
VRELRLMPDLPGAFGEDAFGRRAEAAARFFGTPQYILGQTALVIAWIAINAIAVGLRWDPYPFILLNLAHREEVTTRTQAREAALKAETDELQALLQANTQLTKQDKELTEKIEALTREIHARLTAA